MEVALLIGPPVKPGVYGLAAGLHACLPAPPLILAVHGARNADLHALTPAGVAYVLRHSIALGLLARTRTLDARPEALSEPAHVVLFSGHMVDRPGREPPRKLSGRQPAIINPATL